MAAVDDGPLSKLSREEQAVLAEMARAGADGRIDRRILMQLAGVVGLGGLVALGSGRARAGDASTSDGDGDIGSPSARVDVFGDDLEESGGNDVVSSPDGNYEIQKDGTDGAGVINIKTS